VSTRHTDRKAIEVVAGHKRPMLCVASRHRLGRLAVDMICRSTIRHQKMDAPHSRSTITPDNEHPQDANNRHIRCVESTQPTSPVLIALD
jgi:hypothetical protein